MDNAMDIIRRILLLVYLINVRYQLVRGTSSRSSDWLQDVDGADQLYGPSLLTTTEVSLVICLIGCSNTAKYKAATYNNGTGQCMCFDTKTGMASQIGNRLWNRHFDGFLYNEQLEWHIRLVTNIQTTRAEAESFCGTLEGRLAVLDTDDKLHYFTGLSDYEAERYIFVGATDEETERVFVWSNGANLTTNWFIDEPNGHRDENCVAIYRSAFIDLPCSYLSNFACEKIV